MRDRALAARLAVLAMQEHEIDVRGDVQLASAELAHRDHDEPARAPVGTRARLPAGERLGAMGVIDGGADGDFGQRRGGVEHFGERGQAVQVAMREGEHGARAQFAQRAREPGAVAVGDGSEGRPHGLASDGRLRARPQALDQRGARRGQPSCEGRQRERFLEARAKQIGGKAVRHRAG